ncbi:hypothetical protein D7Z96_18825 [Pseudarthrobacter phenanthrenivorans]|uniref:Uncharacterized protein n=1 Tax=Pseudarthrobacter phenanthrenivorans TaxID=361575 RepID=A0A3B0FKN4_PSEPS|nr:hypothetical protein D7Z96_18825 [Pseudarthrobacter phenanthrenivorans]
MAESVRGALDISDPNEILNTLLSRLEEAIQATETAASGLPLFAVEAELTRRLRVALPDARFTAEDIRAWSAQIAS